MKPSSSHPARLKSTGTFSARVIAVPPTTGTFRSLPSTVVKPIHRPSGEKNGVTPPSVPARGSALRLSRRFRMSMRPVSTESVKTMLDPSGAIAAGEAMDSAPAVSMLGIA